MSGSQSPRGLTEGGGGACVNWGGGGYVFSGQTPKCYLVGGARGGDELDAAVRLLLSNLREATTHLERGWGLATRGSWATGGGGALCLVAQE